MLKLLRYKNQSLYVGGHKVKLLDIDIVVSLVYVEIDDKLVEIPNLSSVMINNTEMIILKSREYKDFKERDVIEVLFGFKGSDIVDREEVRNDQNYRGRYGK